MNDAAGATALSMASPTAGRIDYAADPDWFKVTLTAGTDYEFMTLNLGSGMDTVLRLIDVNGSTLIQENDNAQAGALESRITYTAAASGDHYLVVIHKDAAATSGTYQVNAILGGTAPPPPPPDDHANDTAGATVITIGQTTAGRIEIGGDIDYFKVTLTGGQSYDFHAQTQADTTIELIDAQGQQLAFDDDGGPGLSSLISGWQCPADGDYYLIVAGFGSSTPDYDVLADGATPPPPDDHGNDIANATAMALATPTPGKIEIGTDEDMFKVTLTGGQSYDFRTATQGDTVLYLYDAQGNQLDMNDDEDAAQGMFNSYIQAWQCPSDGDYYLKVTGYQAMATTPDYDITATQLGGTPPPPPPVTDDHGNDAAGATAVVTSSTTAGHVEQGGDVDWFSVDLVAGESYEFRTDGNQIDTALTLFASDGTTQLDFNDDIDPATQQFNSSIAFVATQSGTVYLQVAGYLQTTPQYDISVIVTTPPAPPAANAQLASSAFNDVDGDGRASQGDTVVLNFSEDITIIQIAIFPPPPIDPAMELDLKVQGDSWGQGATMLMGPGSKAVTVTLGTNPVLKLSGTYAAANTTAGSASGVDVSATTSLQTMATGTAVVANEIDLDSTLTAGFVAGATLNEARGYHTATLLDDGRVLVVGGRMAPAAGSGLTFAYSSEIHDAGAWTDATDPAVGGTGAVMAALDPSGQAYYIGRYDHFAVKLPGGKVLIAGGVGFEALFDTTQTPPAPIVQELQSAFVFDPTTNAFTPTANTINMPRRAAYATVMPNGQVLISGGYNGNVNNGQGGTLPLAEVFDPAQETFTALQGINMEWPRENGSAHLLASGNVLHVGGHMWAATQTNPNQVNLYIAPGTSIFDQATGGTTGPALDTDRRWHAASEPGSGEIMIFGGDSGQAAVTSVEKYDPTAGTFSKVGDLQAARARAKAVLFGANVLVVGGMSIDYTAGAVTDVATAELYNRAANVTEIYQMRSARNSFRVVKMPNGNAMVIGGFAGGATTISGIDGTAVGECEIFQIP